MNPLSIPAAASMTSSAVLPAGTSMLAIPGGEVPLVGWHAKSGNSSEYLMVRTTYRGGHEHAPPNSMDFRSCSCREHESWKERNTVLELVVYLLVMDPSPGGSKVSTKLHGNIHVFL